MNRILRGLGRLLPSFMLPMFALLPFGTAQGQDDPASLRILCTTFPVWLITRNVAADRTGVKVDLLLAAQMGCPHDYALTPQDMQKLAAAQILVINGLGLEEFLDAPLKKANEKIKIIDTTHDIPAAELLRYTDDQHADAGQDKHVKNPPADPNHSAHKTHGEKSEDAAPEGHPAHTGVNPHLFASPRLAGAMAMAIAEGLCELDPAGKDVYEKNATTYAARMQELSTDFTTLGKKLTNRNIVLQHGAFDYLARDTGLRIVAVLAAHAGQEPSAAEMLNILKEIRKEKAGAVFTEPQYPARVGETLAKEAGIKSASLDPTASGPDNADLNYYQTVMRKNLQTLRDVLGTR